ncbi:MAG: hypothetical protein ABFD82_06610 [Syntrophaceae bacterium]
MSLPKRYPIIIWLCILFLVLPLGCAQTTIKYLPKDDFGSVGIVCGNFIPEVMLDKPARGWLYGAGRGSANLAGKWASKILSIPDFFQCPQDIACAFVLISILAITVSAATIGGLAGAVDGAVKAEPSKKVDEAENIINETVAKLKIQETLRDRVGKEARKKARGRVTVFEGYGPTSIDQIATYGHLANKGIDTILQISVMRFGLIGKWEVNPHLNLEMIVQAKVIRVKDGEELHSEIFRYTGGSKLFSEWCVDNARPLHDEFDQCYNVLAENIITTLFL